MIFEVDGIAYDIEQFKLGFAQGVDHKGEPQDETHGGQVMITLNQTLPESFYAWSIGNNKFKDGLIAFKRKSSETILRIEFFRARCINLTRNISPGKGVLSTIVLSPQNIKLNGIEHNNRWKDEY